MSTRRPSGRRGKKASQASATSNVAATDGTAKRGSDPPASPDGTAGDGAATSPRRALYPEEHILPTNADLKRLLQKAMTRLQNWRVELEMNPNPRTVHVLHNILGHMESIARVTETKAVFSYKHLSRQMSLLIGEVAQLNLAITDALDEDDLIDAAEEKRINASLKHVVETAVELIRIVQQGFIPGRPVHAITYTAVDEEGDGADGDGDGDSEDPTSTRARTSGTRKTNRKPTRKER